ncbi:hypothetical protein ACOME3_008934 [Neoechinorhynchus agilis]
MCALTRSLVCRAAMSDTSAPSTTLAMSILRFLAFDPISRLEGPSKPIIRRQAACGFSEVPPPTVPHSIDGIVTLTLTFPPSSISNHVIQLLLETTWAMSCPQAAKMAATTLAA